MPSVTPLNLPPFQIRLRRSTNLRNCGQEVYDPLRRRWVALTPEEWVRQHFVNFLIEHRSFPQALMANEVALSLNGTARRADTVVYTRGLKPLCVVEYKAPEVGISQRVFDQIARYNSVVGATYLIVSNGMHHYCCRYAADGYKFLPDIPAYADMLC